MPADVIQIQYDQLAQVANQFGRTAENVIATQQSVLRSAQQLRQGGWQGRGSTAFFAELDGVALPAIQRLASALQQGSVVTRQIAEVMQAAEAEAAAPFRGRDGTVPGGATVSAEDGFSGGAVGGAAAPTFISGVLANFQETFKVKGKGLSFDLGKGKFGLKPELGVDLFSGSLINGKFADGYGRWDVGGGLAGLGLKEIDGKWVVGAAGEVYAGRGKVEGTLIGDQNLGWTGGIEAKALSAKGFIGYYDGSIGGELGGNLASVKVETGANIAGANVGVNAEIGLKMEVGLSVGQDTSVKLGPLTFGISFGGAKRHNTAVPGGSW